MLTFGLSTPIDALSWVITLTLGMKLVATIILLRVRQEVWDRPGWGANLWWITKITPIIAVPCFALIAVLQGDADLVWLSTALMLFVIVAVPWKVRQRRKRIAARTSVTTSA